MDKQPFYKILSLFVDIRRDELATSLLMFFYFFLVTMSTYIIKPVKISLFLERLSFKNLPFAYLLTALLIGFVVTLNSKLLRMMNRQVYVSISLAVFIISLIVFWWLFQYNWEWLSLLFWFWADLFTAVSITQFWILVNDAYNPRQAKRLIGFLVSGGLLGGITGALLASILVKIVRTEDLLLVCPVLLMGCLLLMLVLRVSKAAAREAGKKVREGEKKEKVGYKKSFRSFIQSRHLVILSGIIASAIIVTTLIDFQFNTLVERNFGGMNQRTAFLGSFFTFLLILSFLLHVLTTNRILKNFGIRAAILITPIVLLIGTLAVFMVPVTALFTMVVILKGADKSLTHSLSQSVRELLYIPVDPEIKYRAKVFIDMFVNKLARGIAAFILLLCVGVLSFGIKQISFVVLFFVLLWIGLNWMVTKEYVGIVKENLRIKWLDADRFISDKIDLDMTKLVFDTLQNKQRSSVLYAMNVFDLIKSEKLSPELKRIISSKCDEIRACSMDSLLELDGEALLPEMDDAIEEDHLDEQIEDIMSLDVYQELMNEEIGRIVQKKNKEADVVKMEAAKVIGMLDSATLFIPHLIKLLMESSPEVLRYALETSGKLKRRELVPLIIAHLKNPATEREASRALEKYGTKVLGTLKDYLADKEEDLHVRKVIPDVMCHIGTQKAADMLAIELKKGSVDIESDLIEALFKLRTKESHIRFNLRHVKPELLSMIKKCYLILIEMKDLMTDKKKVSLALELENNLARSLKHVFELLGLVYPHEDILLAYQNISTGTRKSISFSCELLDNILAKEYREYIFPLIDDIPFDEKVKRCRKMFKVLERNETS